MGPRGAAPRLSRDFAGRQALIRRGLRASCSCDWQKARTRVISVGAADSFCSHRFVYILFVEVCCCILCCTLCLFQWAAACSMQQPLPNTVPMVFRWIMTCLVCDKK